MSEYSMSEYSIYSERQQRILGLLPPLIAPLSLVGSSLIIYAILIERRTTLKSVYQRLILGMSIMDFITSLDIILFCPWAMPEEASDFVAGARGTFQTCEVSVFHVVFGLLGCFLLLLV
jgi:hypothetical protein